MQTRPTTPSPDPVHRSPPGQRSIDDPASAAVDPDAPRHAATVSFGDAVPGLAVEVRYGLDPVANVWVASFFDGSTGEFMKSVPSTKVMHQLAELRAQYERRVDRAA